MIKTIYYYLYIDSNPYRMFFYRYGVAPVIGGHCDMAMRFSSKEKAQLALDTFPEQLQGWSMKSFVHIDHKLGA